MGTAGKLVSVAGWGSGSDSAFLGLAWRLMEFSVKLMFAPTMAAVVVVAAVIMVAVGVTMMPRSPWVRRRMFGLLSWCGPAPLPRHVAFVMDGNRRWAQQLGMRGSEGHPKGSDKLMDALEWCHDAQVEQVTVYAFSLENFKRSQDEVDSIMQLATQKFTEMLNSEDVVHKYKFRVRVLGERHLLDPELQSVMQSAELATAHYHERTLNICFAYTSRAEMASAMIEQLHAMEQDDDYACDERSIEESLFTGAHFPDLLIRTSGENRLSDFLLWQCMFAHIVFMSALWPNLSVWHFVGAILSYQSSAPLIMRTRQMQYLAAQQEQRQQGQSKRGSPDAPTPGEQDATGTAENVQERPSPRHSEKVAK